MLLTVHVQPNAKTSAIVKWLDEDTVKIKIAAPAVDGKANLALVEFLAEYFNKPKSQVVIVRGLTARMKQVRIP
ncbi:MAG: DUF167 domain-containing protein [Patescibacteria group bacterium]